jgi:tetratricopeptide (TPR) repeat protein
MLQVIPNWLNWLVLVLYVLTTFYFYLRGNINLAFAMAFVFIVSAGSMTPLKVSWMVAERYMFLGGLGIAIVLALMLENFSEKLNLFKWLLTAILISFFGYRIFLRNINWQTNHNLWVNTCQVSPNSHNAWNNIGDDYDKLKQYENAVKGFTQSTVVKNDYADAYHNRANIFFKINRLDLARDSYLTALKYNPGLYQSYVALIQVAMSENKVEEAFSYGNTLLKYQPNNPLVHYIFGVLYKQIGKSEEAKKAFTKALQIDPNFNQARIQLSSTT